MRQIIILPSLWNWTFQFTHPVRGATEMGQLIPFLCQVSIHAPRAGCDQADTRLLRGLLRFNSRTPCGVRLCYQASIGAVYQFQFTHPVRGATVRQVRPVRLEPFQFTHPVRGATPPRPPAPHTACVSIHAPRAGCDTSLAAWGAFSSLVSIHAPRAGCDGRSLGGR